MSPASTSMPTDARLRMVANLVCETAGAVETIVRDLEQGGVACCGDGEAEPMTAGTQPATFLDEISKAIDQRIGLLAESIRESLEGCSYDHADVERHAETARNGIDRDVEQILVKHGGCCA